MPRKKTHEEFIIELNDNFPGKYKVLTPYKNSKTKINVVCNDCGEPWNVSAGSLLRNGGCPTCSGKKKKDSQMFAYELCILTKGEYSLIGVYKGAHESVDIIHHKCGNSFKTAPNSILRGKSSCTRCADSKGVKVIEKFLNSVGLAFEREFAIDCGDKSHPYRIDFFVSGIGVEYDGEQHFKAIEHFGGETALLETQRRDRTKDKYCADNGIPLIRIPYWEYDNIDEILTRELLPLLDERAS